jgi:putative two-component system response regulator
MSTQHLHILVIESDQEEIRRIEWALSSARGAVEAVWGLFEITPAATLTEALTLVRASQESGVAGQSRSQGSGGRNHESGETHLASCLATAEANCTPVFDAALLSLRLADSEGVSTLIKLLAAAPHLPVVVLADEDDQTAMALIHEGAQDYLLRSERSPRLLTRTLRASIQRKRAELAVAESRLGIIWRLAKAAEYRDEETGNHVVRVGCYSKLIAESLGLDHEFVGQVFLTAPLHDIGKIGIPDAILRKPGPLTKEEWTVMRQHCQIGAEILRDDAKAMEIYRSWHGLPDELEQDDPLREMACRIALTHHERWDGTGYPAGLDRERIPLEGRIVALCDVFDALVSERPYKKAYSEEQALEILRDGSGRHFDPLIVTAFEASLPQVRQVRQRFSDISHDTKAQPADEGWLGRSMSVERN